MKKFLLLILIFFQGGLLYAQYNYKTVIRAGADSNISLVVFAKPMTLMAEDVLKRLNATGEETTYKLMHSFVDKSIIHEQYQQYYNGIKVREGNYAVHSQGGAITMINGRFATIHKKNLVSLISKQTAKDAALNFVMNKTKQAVPLINSIETIISPNDFNSKTPFQLAFAITTTNPLYTDIFISATTGQVLGYSSLICTTNAPGTGDTHYSGNRNIITDQVTNPVNPNFFRLRENRNGVSIAVRNMAAEGNWQNTGAAVDFFDNDNNWTQAEHGIDDVAIEVKWAIENILDYWRLERGRNSYNDVGGAVNAYVHDNFPIQFGQDNAVWNGSNFTLNFADGNFLGPHSSLDICGHEFGHGVCQSTSALVGGNAESGALNEGFSDIWGEAVEVFSASGKPQWLHGSDIVGPFNTCVRNLQNPTDFAASEGQHPNTYLGPFWRTDGEPHFNSTVLSHWFFLLSEGGNGTNVNGLTINVAAAIAYETEKWLSNTADYPQARVVSVQRAIAMYGANSCEVRAVENA